MINTSWIINSTTLSFFLCIVAVSINKNKAEIVSPMCLHSLLCYIMLSLNYQPVGHVMKNSQLIILIIFNSWGRGTPSSHHHWMLHQSAAAQNTHKHVTVDMYILSQAYTHTHTHTFCLRTHTNTHRSWVWTVGYFGSTLRKKLHIEKESCFNQNSRK